LSAVVVIVTKLLLSSVAFGPKEFVKFIINVASEATVIPLKEFSEKAAASSAASIKIKKWSLLFKAMILNLKVKQKVFG
jgi:hypothetical protein